MGCCFGDRTNQVHTTGGLQRQRSCTDSGWLLVFAAFCAGLGVVLCWAVRKGGDPERLINGVDSHGNICGRENGEKLPGAPGSGRNTTGLTLLVLEDALGYRRHCAARCPEGYRQTLFRRCVSDTGPTGLALRTLNISSLVLEELIQDLAGCRQELGLMGVIALGLSVAALVLLRYCVAVLVWFLLLALSLGCVGGTCYLWFSWNARRRNAQPTAGPWLAAAVAGTTAMVLILLTVLVLRKRIQLVTALFAEAGKALAAMPGLLLQPAWTLSFCALSLAAGALAMLFVLTAGDTVVVRDYDTGETTIVRRQDSLLRLGPWYLGLALCWLLQLAVNCQSVVVAGAAADWYFNRGSCPAWGTQWASLWRLVRYHLGSVLLGSLLVALARLLRLLYRLASRRCRRVDKSLGCLCCCCAACCVGLRFLNRNAFILLAARGYGLCRAAREAWQLLSRNALRVATINCVGDFMLLLAKVAVVAGTTYAGHRLLQGKAGQLRWGEWGPLSVGALGSLLVAHSFLSVYEMTLDTLFLCFCHDCESSDDAATTVPEGLAAFVEKSRSMAAPPNSRH
ncbi:choline transporter-like protein 1 [Haemaphysalis longicornis]